ncbi:MAG: ribosome maturation factor RimM, partial [Candidatus Zixiibacteriota bacterium]
KERYLRFLNNPVVPTEEFITVGQLARPRGTEGEMYVTPLTDFPGRFENMTEIFVSAGDSWQKMKILSSKMISGRPVIRLENVKSPEEAARFTKRYLAVPKSQIMTPPANSYYIFDLVGCEVFDEKSNRKIGAILEVEEYPANDVYVIKTDDNKRLTLAAVKAFVKKVDVENRKIVIDSTGLMEE